jgi:hypothetical protein
MRKLVSLVVCIAILIGATANVALAYPAGKGIRLDSGAGIYYLTGNADDTISISGVLVDSLDQPVSRAYVILASQEAVWDICRTDAAGRFSLELPGNAAVGSYLIDAISCQTQVTVVPELLSMAALGFIWDELENEDFVYRYSACLAFVPEGYAHVGLRDAQGTILAYAPIAPGGEFELEVGRDSFILPGVIDLVLGTVAQDFEPDLVIARGEIIPGELRIDLDRRQLVYDVPQALVLTLSAEQLGRLHAPLSQGKEPQITSEITYVGGAPLEGPHPLRSTGVITRSAGAVQVIRQWGKGALRSLHVGDYELRVSAQYGGVVYYTATVGFSVKPPILKKLQGVPTETTVAEGLDLKFGWDGVHAVFRSSNAYEVAPYYRVSCTGVAEMAPQQISVGEDFRIRPLQAGQLELYVEAYRDKDYRILLGTYSAKIEVRGGHIQSDRPVVEVGEDSTVTFLVTTNADTPVNNAYIYISKQDISHFSADQADLVIDPSRVNIHHGSYNVDLGKEGKRLVRDLGEYTVYAVQAGQLLAATPFRVVGANVYHVTLDKEYVLAGESAELIATITDKSGNAVTPEEAEISYVDGSGCLISYRTLLRPVRSADGTLTEEFKITLLPPEIAGEHVVTVKTHEGRRIGQAVAKAVLPQLKHDCSMLTSAVVNEFELELVNPLTNQRLGWTLTVSGDGFAGLEQAKLNGESLTGAIRRYADNRRPDTLQLYGGGGRLALLVSADLESAVTAGRQPEITLSARRLEVGKLPVGAASLTLSRTTAVVGVLRSDTIATLADAEGHPLAGYRIVCGSWSGVTDANGQVVYTNPIPGHDPLTFTALLDAGSVSAVLQPVADQTAPTISYPASVSRSTATITISDNARLTRVRVDGTELEVGATDKLTHQVSLQVGSNRFQVEAEDYSGNTTRREIVTITYVPPSVTLRGDDDVLRIGGYSLVPVGELRALGGEPSWSISAGTAAVSAAGRRVEMAVGSTIAMVNGSPAMMPVAPVSVRGRIYVPVRFVADSLGWSVLWQPGDVITLTAR